MKKHLFWGILLGLVAGAWFYFGRRKTSTENFDSSLSGLADEIAEGAKV